MQVGSEVTYQDAEITVHIEGDSKEVQNVAETCDGTAQAVVQLID